MVLTDFLTILSIVVAVIALMSDENRKLTLLKFDRSDWFLLLTTVLILHLIFSFEWFLERIPQLAIFVKDGWPTPSTWAYILTIITLFRLFWIISYSPFSKRKINDVISLYQSLILKNAADKVVDLVQKHHLTDIVNYHKELNTIDKKYVSKPTLALTSHQDIVNNEVIKNLAHNDVEKLRSDTRMNNAHIVYQKVIKNNRFISMAVSQYPLLFVDIIKSMNTQKTADRQLVQDYCNYLIRSNIDHFKQELKLVSRTNIGVEYHVTENQPILFALTDDLNVAIHNELWKSFGESAISELRIELKSQQSILLKAPPLGSDNDPDIWDLTVKKAVVLLDILVRRAIVKQSDCHKWMIYYVHFLRELTLPSINYGLSGETRIAILVDDIFSRILNWCELAYYFPDNKLTSSIIKTLIDSITTIVLNGVNDRDKGVKLCSNMFTHLAELNTYIHIDEYEISSIQHEFMNQITKLLEEINSESSVNRRGFIQALRAMWDSIDKKRYSEKNYEAFLNAFANSVVVKL